MRSPSRAVLTASLGLLASLALRADPSAETVSTGPAPDALSAMQRLRVAPGLKVSLWAGEPLVRDVTSVSFDNRGRAYVVETGRRRTSVFDVRGLGPWLDDDFSFRTTGDRASFLRQVLDPADPRYGAFLGAVTRAGRLGFQDFNGDGQVDWKDLEVESERIRRVTDEDGDGAAEHARTFVDGFRTSISGVAAGVLAEGTNVWFTCIPDLWRFNADDLRFASGTNALSSSDAALKESHRVLSGFGVHIAFGGHDLHGLIKGPDGRIYFTIADRGSSVTNREGRVVALPDSGAVFRCEPDGSGFEIFARGFRNPQELAFDALGNLWTGDNNGDGGDKARWTLVLEGADYGWTIGWQWLPRMGAWNSERLWHTREGNTAACIVPPVAHVGHGPAGIAFYPGTGLGDAYRDHFFYSDFPGGIRAFRVEPDGAFFKIAGDRSTLPGAAWMEDNSSGNMTGKLLWDLSPVDVAFPPFGGVIVADWVQGWDKTGKGRLWHVTDPALASDPRIAGVRRLLGEGMATRKARELVELLGHADMRVRLEAQWEMARRGAGEMRQLSRTATRSTNRLARLHALWGLGQVFRTLPRQSGRDVLSSLLPLLGDRDPEIRGQSAKLFAAARFPDAMEGVGRLIGDSEPRVRFLALEAVAELASRGDPWQARAPRQAGADWPGLMDEIVRVAERDPASDPAIEHALGRAVATLGLGEPGNQAVLGRLPARLKLACLRGFRRTRNPDIGRFLDEADPVLVLEAARAINDEPVTNALPRLAGLLGDSVRLARDTAEAWPAGLAFSREEWRTWTLRRSVNAAFRLGGESNATAIAAFAARADTPESVRVEALEALADWGTPPKRDRIVGLHRPIPARDAAPAKAALAAVWDRLAALESPATVAVAALRAGERLSPPGFSDTLARLAMGSDSTVQKEVSRIREAGRAETFEALVAALETGTVRERQRAFARIAASTNPAVTTAIAGWTARLAAGRVVPEMQADVLDVARGFKGAGTIRERLAAWTNALAKDDALAAFRSALAGGDAANGRRLFAERADWGCQRCHRLGGEGGDLGPELRGLGRTKGREHVLRSILDPNADIAEGFESVVVGKADGTSVAGILKSENATTLVIQTAEEGLVSVPKPAVKSRERGPSAMPDGLGDLMTLRELRDLVEALSE